jgi:hypothetical protein
VYSFGVIVFRMLAGCLPFEGGDLREKLAQATTAARPSLHALRSDLPVAVDEWVEQSLAIDRERRESVRASFDALHLALGLPLEKREHDAESSSKIRRVRRWLASPLGGLQGSMAAAFRAATGVFERLKRSTTSMLPALPANGGARVAEDSIAIAERETVLDGRARASTSGSIRSGVSALPPPPPRVRGAQKSEPESFLDLSDFAEDALDTDAQGFPIPAPPESERATRLFSKSEAPTSEVPVTPELAPGEKQGPEPDAPSSGPTLKQKAKKKAAKKRTTPPTPGSASDTKKKAAAKTAKKASAKKAAKKASAKKAPAKKAAKKAPTKKARKKATAGQVSKQAGSSRAAKKKSAKKGRAKAGPTKKKG